MAEENGVPTSNEGKPENNVKPDQTQKQQQQQQGATPTNNGKGGGGKKRGKDDVCRDFLNGICNRGPRCRFIHPENEESSANQSITPYTFCIDFQNRGCFRDSCRFVHATGEDAERYQRKGVVSLPLARAIAATLTINDSINGIPICKEFQNGSCSRGGNRCRYWHVNVDEERAARANMVRMGGGGGPGMGPAAAFNTPGMRRGAPPLDFEYEIPAKRPYPGARMPPPPHLALDGAPPTAYITSLERRNAELEKENEALRREVEREKGRYEDLLAVFKSQGQSHHQPAPVPAPHQLDSRLPHPLSSYPPYGGYHESHHPSWN